MLDELQQIIIQRTLKYSFMLPILFIHYFQLHFISLQSRKKNK